MADIYWHGRIRVNIGFDSETAFYFIHNWNEYLVELTEKAVIS